MKCGSSRIKFFLRGCNRCFLCRSFLEFLVQLIHTKSGSRFTIIFICKCEPLRVSSELTSERRCLAESQCVSTCCRSGRFRIPWPQLEARSCFRSISILFSKASRQSITQSLQLSRASLNFCLSHRLKHFSLFMNLA